MPQEQSTLLLLIMSLTACGIPMGAAMIGISWAGHEKQHFKDAGAGAFVWGMTGWIASLAIAFPLDRMLGASSGHIVGLVSWSAWALPPVLLVAVALLKDAHLKRAAAVAAES